MGMSSDLSDRPDILRPARTSGAEEDVGANIHRLRARRNWTLQQAADETGVSFSTLSKIERGEISPTVTTLSKIAKGFDVGVGRLLDAGDEPGSTGRRSLSRASDGRPNATETCDNVMLCGDLAKKKLVPIRTRVRARSVEDYDEWARYPAEVFLVVMRGRLVIHSELYAPTTLEPGDTIYYDASSGHVWVSEGEEDAEVIWVYVE